MSDKDKILVIALDFPDAVQACSMADSLRDIPLWCKIGLELFTAEGPALVRTIMEKNFPVFLDLKFHDIPNTVKGAVRSATMLGVDMCTIHTGGGEDMCRAAVEGKKEALSLRANEEHKGPLLMGVTVLTSQGGDPGELSSLVVERALLAQRCGLDGIVCSGHEAAAVKKACGSKFLCLCPGIRFADAGQKGRDDQARVCTPAEAVAAGADFLVMGRPVVRATKPADAARAALEQMRL